MKCKNGPLEIDPIIPILLPLTIYWFYFFQYLNKMKNNKNKKNRKHHPDAFYKYLILSSIRFISEGIKLIMWSIKLISMKIAEIQYVLFKGWIKR